MRHLTLKARLTLLVLAGVLPLLGYNLVSVHLQFRADWAQAGVQAQDLAHGLAGTVASELNTRIATLEVLALSRAVAAGDLTAFRTQADAVVARQLPGASILLLQPNGEQLVNTSQRAGLPLPPRQNLDNQRRVLANGQPSVSNLYYGSVLQRPVIGIDVPVRRPDGTISAILSMNPTLGAFARVIRRQGPGEGWVIAVLDGNGALVARVPELDERIGQVVNSDVQRLRQTQSEGIIETVAADGVTWVLAAFSGLDEFGWTVAVGRPVADLARPAWRHAVVSLAVGLALLGLGLILARRIAGGITGPIAALRSMAASRDGEMPAPVETGLREADEVAEALLSEGRRRRATTASLLDSERRLRLVVAELNHRAKNALATVQALADQTARVEPDPGRFKAVFNARLRSLARAHDLLTDAAWEAPALLAVVRAGLAPWLEHSGIAGPRIRLRCAETLLPVAPGQALALVLAMHELATNATKYGALSVPGGSVEVDCRLAADGIGSQIDWQEAGGPPVPGPPVRRGFGSRLLEQALAHDLGPGSTVGLEFNPGGVRASIRFMPRMPAEDPPAAVPA